MIYQSKMFRWRTTLLYIALMINGVVVAYSQNDLLHLDKSRIYRTKMDVPTKINDRQKREDIAFEEDDFNPNGGYGHWSKWSQCNRSCGFGEASRSRECHDVTRCHGGNVELKLCFERKCKSKAKHESRKSRLSKNI